MSASSTEMTKVRDLMTVEVMTVSSSTSVGTALDLMFEHKISALPVVDDDRCVGIVTATDLVALLRATDNTLRSDYPHYDDCLWAVDLVQQKLDKDPVREIMSEGMMTTAPDTPAAEVASMMSNESLHHVIVEQDGKLVGFLSSLDFLKAWKS
jgi:CBS-domain-containing membrane protein